MLNVLYVISMMGYRMRGEGGVAGLIEAYLFYFCQLGKMRIQIQSLFYTVCVL